MSIALVSDSNAQLGADLVDRLAVGVVPLTVTVGGVDHLEGHDLETLDFYRRLAEPGVEVATAAPSPGRFIDRYESLAAAGAEQILSIHVGGEFSATVNNARLAAREVEVAVEVVDTGLASFGVGCCVWEAADAIADGLSGREILEVIRRTAKSIASVFLVQAIDLARSGGRFGDRLDGLSEAVPVLSFHQGHLEVITTVEDPLEAAAVMSAFALDRGEGLRVAIAQADPRAAPIGAAIEDQLSGAPEVLEIVHYSVGPSVAAHTGADTAGLFVYPRTVR